MEVLTSAPEVLDLEVRLVSLYFYSAITLLEGLSMYESSPIRTVTS